MKKLSFLLAFLFFSMAVVANGNNGERDEVLKDEVSVIKTNTETVQVLFGGDCWYITGSIECEGGGGSAFTTQSNECEGFLEALDSMLEMADIICPGGYVVNAEVDCF